MADTQEERPSPAGRPPRTIRRWRMPLAAVMVVAAVGIACVPRLLSDPGRMSRLAAMALPGLEGEFIFRSVSIGWAGPIVLEGIRLIPRDGTRPPLSIARIEVGNGLAAILGSFGDLGRVQVTGLEADVVFDDRDRSNLSGLFRPQPQAASSAARSPRRSPVRMRLEVDGAVVRITSPWDREPWTSDPIDVRATLASATDGAGSEWIVDPCDLLVDARMELGLARDVLAYVAPVLAGATRTGGRFSVRLDEARFPVGRPVDATLAGTLTMQDVVVGPGRSWDDMLARLPAPLPAPPAIRIADGSRVSFQLAERRVVHDGLEFGIPLGQTGRRLDIHSSGTVAIDDGGLDLVLRLPIPADLPTDRPVLAALAGKSVSIGIRGTFDRPQPVFDGSLGAAAGLFTVDLIDRLRAGRPVDNPSEADPAAGSGTADAVIDIVGGIVEEIARLRAERQASEPGDPETRPPPRLRDRRRGGPGTSTPRRGAGT